MYLFTIIKERWDNHTFAEVILSSRFNGGPSINDWW